MLSMQVFRIYNIRYTLTLSTVTVILGFDDLLEAQGAVLEVSEDSTNLDDLVSNNEARTRGSGVRKDEA